MTAFSNEVAPAAIAGALLATLEVARAQQVEVGRVARNTWVAIDELVDAYIAAGPEESPEWLSTQLRVRLADPLTDENLPEEVPAIRPGERTP